MPKLISIIIAAIVASALVSVFLHRSVFGADEALQAPDLRPEVHGFVGDLELNDNPLSFDPLVKDRVLTYLDEKSTGIDSTLKHIQLIFDKTRVRRDFDQLVAYGASRSGGFRRYLSLDLNVASGITIEQYQAVLGKTALAPLIEAAVSVERQYSINSLYILAHAAEESKWGTSPLVATKNNYFGYNAVDGNPSLAKWYPNAKTCVFKVMAQVKKSYLSRGGKYYSKRYGPTLVGMNLRYASNPMWAENIGRIMYQLHLAIGDD